MFFVLSSFTHKLESYSSQPHRFLLLPFHIDISITYPCLPVVKSTDTLHYPDHRDLPPLTRKDKGREGPSPKTYSE